MWLNKGVMATIIPLKQIELIWPVSCNSGSNGGLFVIHSDQGHQKSHHVPYYIDILLNCLGMFNLGIISTFFTLRSYFINLE
jgi:hypothetical protein